MEVYLEYGGGLGDILYQIFHDDGYERLTELGTADRATVVLITHNPHAKELFEFHPQAGRIEVRVPGYWPPHQDREMRAAHGLRHPPSRGGPPRARPVFHAPPADRELLSQLEGRPYVLFSASAGLPDRDIPAPLLRELVALVRAEGLLPVFVGRNYERFGRRERRPVGPAVVDLIDRLTVPGVAAALDGALGAVCCHSAVNMLAWLLRKPQLLLYPRSVHARHIAAKDQWAFGIEFPECCHALFEDPAVPTRAREFVAHCRKEERNMSNAVLETGNSRSFSDFAELVLSQAVPLGQNTGPGNLGFGWIYYGLARNLRPDFVVVIGSCAGFAPFCAARALQDNAWGQVIFIDPSYSGEGHPGWGGRGHWNDEAIVEARFAQYGLTGWIRHLKLTSVEAFAQVKAITAEGSTGMIIIDGAHTADDSMRDFELYASLVKDGYAVMHDSTSPSCEVRKTVETLRGRGYPMVTLRKDVGLTLVELHKAAPVRDTWSYLCQRSTRGPKLAALLRGMIRAGDRILDVYCGFSPLASLLEDVTVFGCDADAAIIEELTKSLPQHTWRQIDERQVPFAALPENIDILMGLGLSRGGHAPWDPQHALEVVRYLLGRYFPRGCLFETAADYDDARILSELHATLARAGYRCSETLIDTDMPAFARRKVLMAERGFS
jgi:hypothetical protein